MPITRLSPQLLKTGSNSALLITASNALTASFALNASAGGVTAISAGNGLSGGTITSVGTMSLDTSSVHFLDGVKKELNTEGVISSSTQFTSLTAPFSGSFTGSFRGGLTGTGSWAQSASIATTSSYVLPSGLPVGTISSSTQFNSLTSPFTGSFTGSFRGNLTGTSSFANTSSVAITASVVTTNTVSYTAGTGLSGGGSATLGGSSVTIDAVAGAGISLTAPTNDAINIDTGSAHFTGGVKTRLNTEGVVSSSTQFTSLTAPFTGSFTGSLRGTLTGTSSFANTSSVAITASVVTTNTVSYTAGAGLSGGGSATLGGSSVTIDAVAGAGISLTLPTNDAINLDTGSAHFTGGVKTRLNTEGVISSSTQFTSLTAPFTGSFTGSFRGNLTGTGSWASTSSRAVSSSYALSASFAPGGSGVTINNNTDNYIVTATGTANTLNGEVALQFDGTTRRLAVSGSISSSGAIYLQTGSTLFLGGTGTPATKQVSGGPEAISFQPGATNSVLLWSGLPSDTEGRFLISTNGFTEWGAGGANDQDIALFRNGIGNVSVQSFNTSSLSTFAVYTSQSQEVFAVDTQLARRRVRINGAVGGGTLDISGSSGGIPVLRIETPSVNDIGMSSLVTGDAFVRFYFAPDGDMFWGPGSAVADIQLYRPTTRNLAVLPIGGDALSTFRVLNSATSTVFNVDTTNTRVGVGTATPTHTLQVVGDISSSGLIARAVTSSVSPVYNVKAYGATGNGTTDDYTAISASLSAITTAGGGTLYLPKGNYRIGTGLRITSNTNIKGDGVQNTIINCNHLTTLPGGAMISGSDIDRVVIEDLCLSGSGINGASSIGIRFTLNSNTNTSNVILRNLFVNDQAGDGITIATPILTTLQNVKVRYTAGDGFDVANGTSTNFYECFAVTGLGAGFNLDTMTYSSLVGCAAEVYGISYRFNNCSAISVVSCGSEDPIDRSATNPGYTGISYRNSETSTTSRVSLISCYSRDPRTIAPNGHISGSFQTFNFRAQSGSQVLTPFKVYGNSEFVGQLSASAYTSSITNGVGFVGTASYALASPGGGSGVTINNNTDNYVVTATGTANTLNGESGLTYNGSLLTINSSVSASSYTSSISNGVGYFGTSSRAVTSSYASSVSGYINFTNGLVVTGTLKVSASSGVSEIRGQELDVFANGRVLGLFALGSSGPYATWFDNTNNNEFDIGRSDSVSGVGRSYDFMTYVDRGFGFYTNNVYTPKMLISASGNVGINVTAPPHKLSLSGSFIIGSGSIGVGASPNATLGRIDASNDIVAFSSDRRLKTNITKITSSLERINQLTGFTYKWNDLANTIAGYDTDSTYVGVYAQEVQAVLPEAVKIAPFDNDGTDKSISGQNYLTVQYEKLVPLLIEAIKELKAEVDELRGKSK